tara:strand:+ start:84 stop:476 length:393 start_codon:yes stop_codon:yes gene_type:complete
MRYLLFSLLATLFLYSCGPTVSQKSVWDFYHECEYSHESIIKIVQCGNAARNNFINTYGGRSQLGDNYQKFMTGLASKVYRKQISNAEAHNRWRSFDKNLERRLNAAIQQQNQQNITFWEELCKMYGTTC